VHQRAAFAESFRMTNAESRAIFAAERRIPMQKTTLGAVALILTALLGIATAITSLDARLTEAEGRALADLRRTACNARALTFDAQLACARIEPDTGWAVHRLPIPGFFGLITWLTLGFGLAMLARPDEDSVADMGSTEERERQRKLALAAQAKLREEEAK
jgi:hypothetical protein